jgi:hypothetical protein
MGGLCFGMQQHEVNIKTKNTKYSGAGLLIVREPCEKLIWQHFTKAAIFAHGNKK